MRKDIQLIELYCVVCHHYNTRLVYDAQRCSNNFCPKFTDEECLTIALWGIANQKFTQQTAYDFTKDFYADWFPQLPEYKAFNKRVCYLADAFKSLASLLLGELGCDYDDLIHLIDSMPIVVAKQKRMKRAKAASEICNIGYCDSKKMYYYGVKLHALGQRQYQTIPMPRQMMLTPASPNDLTIGKTILEDVYGIALFGDKAYKDKVWEAYMLANNDIEIYTPVKLEKGQKYLESADSLYSAAVSRVRQPIESFFNWLQEKTHMEAASKVRSYNGLMAFIFSRIAVACLILMHIVIA